MNTCQKCQSQFEITADDNSFYEKMGVLPPKLCPDCRGSALIAAMFADSTLVDQISSMSVHVQNAKKR